MASYDQAHRARELFARQYLLDHPPIAELEVVPLDLGWALHVVTETDDETVYGSDVNGVPLLLERA